MWQWFSTWLKQQQSKKNKKHAHMTFGRTSLGNRIQRTGVLVRQRLWIWPIVAFLLLAAGGYWIMSSIQSTMESGLRSELTTVLKLQSALVEKWLTRQKSISMTLSNDYQLRELITKLIETRPIDVADLQNSPADGTSSGNEANQLMAQISKKLGPTLSIHDYSGFIVTDRSRRVRASSHPELIGRTAEQFERFLRKVMAGEASVCPPFSSLTAIMDDQGRLQTGTTTMFVSVPIRDDDFQIVAALSLRIQPEREFTQLMQYGRMGQSGETYAFDRFGNMLSNSRFENDLILLGLIPDNDRATSILNLQLRDPGGNMLVGFRPKVRRGELPLTKNVASAIEGGDGLYLGGYRDYRGVSVVGAWSWLDEYEFGLTTEMDYDEAFEPLSILKRTFYGLFSLLAISSLAIFAFMLIVSRLQREAMEAAIEARQLGQYRLEEKLGEGAMGVVYRGHHAMLRRPAAIKLLHTQRVNEASIARFEHEVQITCQLNNPHTVAIYDYGRTPEGVFYYAMEYLDGIDLQDLVDRYGPQSEGRVAKILDQLCSSLFEAHSQGLVHRDIKPANIMLNRRGGEPDFVKLLDFGLVRAMDDAKRSNVNEGMAGTPLYMSPESIQTPDLVDSRSDLYAVGAVGYFLLTGATVFEAKSLGELCQQHIDAIPLTPSQRLGRQVNPDLEHAILTCLEKNRARRPQTARDLAAKIHKLCTSDAWPLSEAEAWWGRHEREVTAVNRAKAGGTILISPGPVAAASKSHPYEQTILHNESTEET
jgi:eukaryotic-like serine/threonine-protein kinase